MSEKLKIDMPNETEDRKQKVISKKYAAIASYQNVTSGEEESNPMWDRAEGMDNTEYAIVAHTMPEEILMSEVMHRMFYATNKLRNIKALVDDCEYKDF